MPPISLNDPTDDPWLDATSKGIPHHAGAMRLSEVGARGWNVLRGELPLPVAVLHASALAANSAWMSAFARQHGLLLAPHGKTTMAPALFHRQLGDGAWAITVATSQQLQVAIAAGVRRIILANQPLGQSVDACFTALSQHPDLELFVLADSISGVRTLAAGARRALRPHPPLKVLVEIGASGARTGCREVAGAVEVARAVSGESGLLLAGIEAFEGVLGDEAGIAALLQRVSESARAIDALGLFGEDIVLSAGGSAWFDLVTLALDAIRLSRPARRVLRSGCYLTLDHFGYARDLERMRAQQRVSMPDGRLQPALEVWSLVQSRPDPDKVLLNAGKRDIGYDVALPQPIAWYRHGAMDRPAAVGAHWRVTGLNDHHAHLSIPADAPLAVGDLVALGIAHPCTTLERWQVLLVVNERLDVIDAIRTYF